MSSTFDTVDKVCAKHGLSVHTKLTTDKRAKHICVKCALEILQSTGLQHTSSHAKKAETTK